jgi:hypothetical protein
MSINTLQGVWRASGQGFSSYVGNSYQPCPYLPARLLFPDLLVQGVWPRRSGGGEELVKADGE